MVKQKLKFIVTAILSIALVVFPATGLTSCSLNPPESFVCQETDLTLELSFDKTYYIVTDCPEDKVEVSIIDSYYGRPVREISDTAFDGCKNLAKLNIPDCMTDISTMALSACENLEYTETEDAKYLGNEKNPYVYFVRCLSEDIKTIEVESNCKAIGTKAFERCRKLDKVVLPDGLESIGNGAFNYCGFISIKLPNSLTNIGVRAFEYCQSLKSITIPNGITVIRPRTFYGCYRLTSVKLSEKLTKIWEKAFTDTGLKSVTIPEGVTGIGFCAFESCGDLTSVTIPASVKAINEAFLDCCDLETIRFNGTKEQWEKVVKSGLWDFNVPAKSVTCTDGAVKLLK